MVSKSKFSSLRGAFLRVALLPSRVATGAVGVALMCTFASGAAVAAGKVNINSASREEMQTLDGVGPKLADAIVTDREDNGSFASVEDLARVPGVSSGLVQKLYDKVSVGGGSSGATVLREGEKVSRTAVQAVLRKFAGEPTIREVQNAAVAHARVDPELIDSMRWRLRTASALPQFRINGDAQQNLDLAERNEVGAPNVLVSQDDKSFGATAQMTWDLDQLIFNRDELGLSRETVRLGNTRDRVVDTVTRRYYERRRLQIDLELSPPTDLGDSVRKELRVQELTADIDALTGGWYSSALERVGEKPY